MLSTRTSFQVPTSGVGPEGVCANADAPDTMAAHTNGMKLRFRSPARIISLPLFCFFEKLSPQKVLGLLDQHIAAHVGDSFSQRKLLGASLYAVLRKAALLDCHV